MISIFRFLYSYIQFLQTTSQSVLPAKCNLNVFFAFDMMFVIGKVYSFYCILQQTRKYIGILWGDHEHQKDDDIVRQCLDIRYVMSRFMLLNVQSDDFSFLILPICL